MTMGKRNSVAFQIGQLAESRSFLQGYRCAWFRLRILKAARKKGQIKYCVEYYDFTHEGQEWLSSYEVPPKEVRGSKEGKRELMLRPKFPDIYRENELPDLNTISEVAVVVDGVWSVGDLVDWFTDGCYWSGKIVKVMGNDAYKVKLVDKPVGEGGEPYDAKYKDLRPSLNWSPDFGWTLPAPVGSRVECSHARLIQPVKQAPLQESLVDVVIEEQNGKATPRSSLDFNGSISSHTSASSLPLLNRSSQHNDSLKQSKYIFENEKEQTCRALVELDTGASAMGKPSCSDSVSSTNVEGVSAEVPLAASAENQDSEHGSAKKMRANETIRLNSPASGSTESALMDLEELLSRVKCLKQMLRFGSTSTSPGQTWKLLEHPAVSTPK